MNMEIWIKDRLAKYTKAQRQAVAHMTEGDWKALRVMEEEFDGPWGKDEQEAKRRQITVQRFLAKQPKINRNGFEYDAPYSMGLHLAALQTARGFEKPKPELTAEQVGANFLASREE